MCKEGVDYKSKFRILKGGKISLVVSAFLVGTISTPSFALIPPEDVTIDDANATAVTFNGSLQSVTVTESGSLSISAPSTMAISSTGSALASDQTITNDGIITVMDTNSSAYGIYVIGNNGSIDNSGDIEVRADTTHTSTSGIHIVGSNSGSIVNSGTITSNVDGVYVSDGNSGTISNTGTITIDSEDWMVNGIYVNTNRADAIVSNSGTITVDSASATLPAGIYVVTNEDNSTVSNSGTITVSSSATENPLSASHGIFIATNNGDVINSGEITSTSTTTRAIGMGKYWVNVPLSMHGDATMINDTTGIITVSGATEAAGLSMDFMHDDSSIINRGTVNAYIDNAMDADAYSIAVGNMEVNTTVSNSGTLYGNLKIPGTFTNSGTVSLPYNAMGVDAANVINYTQTAEGTLQIGLLTDGTTTTYSQLTTLVALFEDGSTIDVNVLASSSNEGAIVGNTLEDVVNAASALTLEGALNVTDNSALLNFEAILDGNTVDLNVTQGQTIADAVADVGENPQSGGAARVLDNLGSGGSAEIGNFVTFLGTLPTNQAVANAVAQVTPTGTVVTPRVGMQVINTMSSVVQARQSSMRGFSSGDIAFNDKNFWFKPFGGYTKQDDVDGISGFDATTYGFGMGVDGEYKAGSRAGLALFYTRANVDTNGVSQESDLDVINLIGYGSNPIIDDTTDLFYQVGLGIQKTDTSRYIVGTGDTASADFDAKSFFLQLKATKEIEISNDFTAKPAIVTSYTHYKNPSYSESGAGALNLDVESFSSDSFVLGVESDFDYKVDDDTKFISNVALSYDFENDAQSVNSSFQGGGAVFSTEGIENSAFIYKAGVGVAKKVQKGFYIDFKYDVDGRGSDYLNHGVSAKFNYKF